MLNGGTEREVLEWKEAFESKGLKVNLGKTKVVVNGAEGEVSVSKVDPCAICRKLVMANSVFYSWKISESKEGNRSWGEILCVEDARSMFGLVQLLEELFEGVETVRGFCIRGQDECKWWLQGSCDSISISWMGEVQGMWRVAELKKVLA